MEPVPLGLGVLNLYGEAHDHCSAEPNGPVNKLYGAEFDVTDTTRQCHKFKSNQLNCELTPLNASIFCQ